MNGQHFPVNDFSSYILDIYNLTVQKEAHPNQKKSVSQSKQVTSSKLANETVSGKRKVYKITRGQ